MMFWAGARRLGPGWQCGRSQPGLSPVGCAHQVASQRHVGGRSGPGLPRLECQVSADRHDFGAHGETAQYGLLEVFHVAGGDVDE